MSLHGDARYRIADLSEELRAYLSAISRPELPALTALRQRTATLPFVAVMQGSPQVGQLLQFLIALTGARRVVEIGVFTGCSTLAMAAALADGGRIVAIDNAEQWPAVGRDYWIQSGCADRIDLRIGDADDVLSQLVADGGAGTFDLVFIDANKDGYLRYFEHALVLLRDNGLMVFDNVLFGGRVAAPDDAAASARTPRLPKRLEEQHRTYAAALRVFNARIAQDERVDVVVLPFADGVTLARKRPLHAPAHREEGAHA